MMNKNKKWFLTLGVVTAMTASGLVMAATPTEKQDAASEKRPVAERDFKHHRGHKTDNTELLALLKIDAETFRTEMKAGKSIVTIAKDHGVSEQKLKEFMTKQMTQRIDAGVKTGKLTAEQAETMKADMDKRVTGMMNGEAPMHRGHGPGHHKMDNSALLTLLNIDQETFRNEMKAGKTLVAIAKDRGISEQELKDFMIQKMTLRIETDVKAGKITSERAETMKADMDKRVTGMINGEAPMHRGHGLGHHKMDSSALLTLLNIDQETFRNEMKAGKTLVAIAQEHGVSEQALKEAILGQMNQRIEDRVKSGKLSADKAEEMKANMEQRVTDMINGKGPMNRR
jgi:transposase-like protein